MDAQTAKIEAINAVHAGASETWKAAAIAVIKMVCSEKGSGGTFTTDDLWKRLDAIASTHERRAMGAMITQAASMGLIRRTGNYINSSRVECNARPVAVWEVI